MKNKVRETHPPTFDPNTSMTAEQKLFNIKKKVNEIERLLKREEEHAVEEDALRLIHVMRVVLVEINREIDRTV